MPATKPKPKPKTMTKTKTKTRAKSAPKTAVETTADQSLVPQDLKDLDRPCPPPDWPRDHVCDVSLINYRYNLRVGDRLVECVLRFRVERCTLGYVVGDLLHSTTLFPGEEVFISTRTRHSVSRFTEDTSFSASQVSRSSDRVWMEAFGKSATDFDESSSSTVKASSHSEFETATEAGARGLLGTIFKGPKGEVKVQGTFDAQSSQEFFGELTRHLESSYHQSSEVTRDTSSVSLTEVNSHREATAERNDELTVNTRRFKNVNRCHTVSYRFYQIGKRQRVRIKLESATCRVPNRFAPTAVRAKQLEMSVGTNLRVAGEKTATPAAAGGFAVGAVPLSVVSAPSSFRVAALDDLDLRAASAVILAELDADAAKRRQALAAAERIIAEQGLEFSFEDESILPTEATWVESELGSCAVCEPYVLAKQRLELERLRLENEKLKQETALLEKHKDYRCCGDHESEPPAADEA